MSWLGRLLSRRRMELDLDKELRFHFESQVADKVRSGIPEFKARRLTRLEFGGIEQIKEDCRQSRGTFWVESIVADVRFAFRTLGKSPGFAAVVVLTLALGIGANAAIFRFVNSVFLKPLSYPHPEQIVSLAEKLPSGDDGWISTLNFLDWERRNRCFDFLPAIALDTVTLTGSGRHEQLKVSKVSASYFKVLGVGATLGRTFVESEGEVGNDREAVLSNRIWQSRFGGDPNVIGRKIALDRKDYRIIGVLPANREFDRSWGVMWLPLAFPPAVMTRNYHWLYAIARLEPGVTLKQACDQMDTIGTRIAALYPGSNKGWGVRVDPYIDQVVQPDLRRSLWVLLAAVGAVLLIGCANVANLTLARGTEREHEMAIRSALGARRLCLIRQLLTESIPLGILGGMAGMALGNAFMRGMKLWLPPDMLPPQANVRMDYGVLVITMAIGILMGILFGLAPALTGTRARSLKESERTTAGLTPHRMRTALVITEVALSFVLLAAASLLIRSVNRLASLSPGVNTTNVRCDGSSPATDRIHEQHHTDELSQGIDREGQKRTRSAGRRHHG
jgi:putative ABC transport system permease protein